LSRTESWKNWAALIVLLVAFGLFAALWPSLSGLAGSGVSSGPRTKLPNETQPIVVALPPTIQVPGLEIADMVSYPGPEINVSLPPMEIPGIIVVETQTIIFVEPIVAVIVVAALVIGLVVMTGLAFTGIYILLSRLVTRTEAKESFQEHKNTLVQKEKEELKELREGRGAAPPPENPVMPRWSAVSTGLIISMFVIFGGMVLASTFYPERLVEVGEELLRPAVIIIGVPLLITVTILLFAPRWGTAVVALIIMSLIAMSTVAVLDIIGVIDTLSVSTMLSIIALIQVITLIILAYIWKPTPAEKVEARIEQADESGLEKGIPYDGIVVLFTGLIVVGLGLGLMVLINSPYFAQIEQLLGR